MVWTEAIDKFYKLFHPIVEETAAIKTEHKVGERQLGVDPKTGNPVFVKIGRYGPVVQIGQAHPDDKEAPKPQFATLMKGQSIETITLEEALKLFDLPRTIGEYEGKDMVADGMSDEEMINFMNENNINCPNCGKHDFTDIRKFNLMFKTFQGVTEDKTAEIYLRPETAQGIFVNFKNVMRTTRRKLPMGIAQVGKAFRNEITPGNFTFRTREFEQMELEFFCKPGTDLEWQEYWKNFCKQWLLNLGMTEENIRLRDHSPEELSHYSNGTTDIEYAFPFGWGELWGIADRTDYDLKSHMNVSKEDFNYQDPETGEKYVPYCIEPSVGADRVTLAFLCDSYEEEEIAEGDTRTVLHLHPALAPYKVAILPLSKNYQIKLKKFMKNYLRNLCVTMTKQEA